MIHEEDVEDESPTVVELRRIRTEIWRIGHNVNQIAHNVNRDMNASIEDESSAYQAGKRIEKHLDRQQQILDHVS
ncbi:MAG: hypothetical protein ABF780_06340 [Bifidobacterium aquikefiri]|nr:hypothetical protein [Bifidobacterium aquikefiri]